MNGGLFCATPDIEMIGICPLATHRGKKAEEGKSHKSIGIFGIQT